jgi:hypothetical protein
MTNHLRQTGKSKEAINNRQKLETGFDESKSIAFPEGYDFNMMGHKGTS